MKHIDRKILQLAQDVIDLDGEQDEAPSLERMARDAREIVAAMAPKRMPATVIASKAASQEEADRERGARIAGLTLLRIALHKEQDGTCPVCNCRLEPALMHCHHILGGPDRRSRESVETMVDLHPNCHDAVHGKSPYVDQREALSKLLSWCLETGRVGAAMALTKRIAKIDEARATRKR